MTTALQTRTGHWMPAHHDGDSWRFLGRRVEAKTLKLSATWSASGNPTIPAANIPSFSWANPVIPILDQKQVGSCVGHASAKILMLMRQTGGQQYIPLSPDGLYSHIDGNVDQGAAPTDAVNWMISNGVETLADVPDEFILASQIPDHALKTALRFRITKADVYQLKSFDECVTASFLRFGVILTINVGGAFTPNPTTGLVNFTPGWANHCVAATGKWDQKTGCYWFDNSWTTEWGVGGRGSMQAKHIDQQPETDLWAIKTATIDPLDPSNPPA